MSVELMHETKTRHIEGTRLALVAPRDDYNHQSFMKYFYLFLKTKVFISTMAPLVRRMVGPTWFRYKFPRTLPAVTSISNRVWAHFLTPNIRPTRLEVSKSSLGFTSCQTNLVARQFGQSQMLPASLYQLPTDVCWSERQLAPAEFMWNPRKVYLWEREVAPNLIKLKVIHKQKWIRI